MKTFALSVLFLLVLAWTVYVGISGRFFPWV